jgi:hypothetical protein
LTTDFVTAGNRHYGREIRALIDDRCTGQYSAPQVAAEIVEWLIANDPDLLLGYLHVHAVTLVRQAINDRDRSTRTHNRVTARRKLFAEAAGAFEDGEPEQLVTHFLSEVHTVKDGSKRKLAEMTGSDLLYVANAYRQQAHDLRMRDSFLRALAGHCGDKTVGDMYTEEQLAKMWGSIAGQGG